MTALPTLEGLEKKGGLVPWAQTKAQRLDIVKDLDHISEQFIEREQAYGGKDVTAKQLYLEGVSLIVALKEPKAHYEFKQCLDQGKGGDYCMQDFAAAYNRWFHLFDKKILDKRKNPHQGYNRAPKW